MTHGRTTPCFILPPSSFILPDGALVRRPECSTGGSGDCQGVTATAGSTPPPTPFPGREGGATKYVRTPSPAGGRGAGVRVRPWGAVELLIARRCPAWHNSRRVKDDALVFTRPTSRAVPEVRAMQVHECTVE